MFRHKIKTFESEKSSLDDSYTSNILLVSDNEENEVTITSIIFHPPVHLHSTPMHNNSSSCDMSGFTKSDMNVVTRGQTRAASIKDNHLHMPRSVVIRNQSDTDSIDNPTDMSSPEVINGMTSPMVTGGKYHIDMTRPAITGGQFVAAINTNPIDMTRPAVTGGQFVAAINTNPNDMTRPAVTVCCSYLCQFHWCGQSSDHIWSV